MDQQDLPLDNEVVLSVETEESNVECIPEDIPEHLWKRWLEEAQQMDKMDDVDRVLEQAEKGTNWGVPTGIPLLDKHTHGIQKARYYLLGAESGAGKTTVGDFINVFQLWEWSKKMNRKVKIFYCSFEIGKTEKKFRWMSYLIWKKFGVRLPSFYLQGHVFGMKLSKEHRKMAEWAKYKVKEMMEDIVILEDAVHPTAIYQSMILHFEKHGTVSREQISEEDQKAGKHGRILGYREKDPDLMSILFIDHLALTGPEMGLSTKGVMDKMSRYGIVLRNMFKCTIVFLQQFSTEMLGTFREMAVRKGDTSVLKPTRLDFGDSKATYRDADVVYGLMKPPREVKEYLGYKLEMKVNSEGDQEGLGDNFTACHIIKNRYGNANRMVPLFVDGSVGDVEELPIQGQSFPLIMQDWYDRAKAIEDLCQVFSPKGA